ncbi:MAG: thioredoxin family protein [Bacteroidales bacterium]|nr:thioredoxin family protein [Bacteroidales bacterium]
MLNNSQKFEKADDLSQVKQTIGNNTGVLVYFYNDDCPPCISLRPKVNELLENQFPLMKMVFADSKQHPDIPAAYQVFSNPTILVFFEGKEFKRFSKYISIPELSLSIERIYKLAF